MTDHKLKPDPSNRAIAADLEFLRRVCNWARLVRVAGVPLLERNPLHEYRMPTNPTPKRPLATYDRYLAVRAKAEQVEKRGLFGSFLDLVEGLGWRVSAVCQLRAIDFDLRQDDVAPFGRIRKRGETDKEGG